MAYTNVMAFHKAQAKIEGTRGTAETTMTRWLTVLSNGGIAATYSAEREDTPETTRSYHADVDTELISETVTIAIEARLSYEEAMWWMSVGLDGGAGTRTGVANSSTPESYLYTATPDGDTDDLDTFTLKIGDGSTCYQYSRVAVNSFTIRCNPHAGGEATWYISLDCVAIFDGTDTFDSPSDIARTLVRARGSKFYLDTSSAIGTTQITGRVRNWSITVENNIEEKRFAESELAAHTDFGRGFQRVTGDFTMEHMEDTYFALMRANTAVKLRFQKEGALISDDPSDFYFMFRVDIPQAKLNSPSESFSGNNKVMTYPFLAEKPSGGVPITVYAQTDEATVAA